MSGRDVLMGGRKIKGYAHLDECLWWRLLLWKQYQQNQLKYYDRSIILLIKFHKYSKHLHKLHESKEQKVRHVISPPSQVPCASGCDGRELFREKVFLSRLTKLVPAWPTFSLFRSLHTFAHRSLFSSLERARDKLPLGNRRRTRCEREDGRRLWCNNHQDMWGCSLKFKYWDADNMKRE